MACFSQWVLSWEGTNGYSRVCQFLLQIVGFTVKVTDLAGFAHTWMNYDLTRVCRKVTDSAGRKVTDLA